MCVLIYSPIATNQSANDDVVSAQTKIIGGHPATLNATAHQASVRLRRNELQRPGSGLKCGGSVITMRTILTAAHCLFDEEPPDTSGSLFPRYRRHTPAELSVVVGQLLLADATVPGATHLRSVAAVLVHPNYTHLYRFDVGVLHLSAAIIGGGDDAANALRMVRPIELRRTPLRVGQVCQVSGWGTVKVVSLNCAFRIE